MANDKIILDVEIREEKALKALQDLKEQATQLRAEQKKLDTTTAEGQRAYEEYAQKIKSIINQMSAVVSSIQNLYLCRRKQSSATALDCNMYKLKYNNGKAYVSAFY